MFQPQQVFAPFAVDGLQQQLLFDRPHAVRPESLQLFAHQLVAGLDHPLAHHILIGAFFGSPSDDRQFQPHLFDQRIVQPGDIPFVGVGFRRQVMIDQIVGHLMAHIHHDFTKVFGLHHFHALAKDRFALVVHHIVELQQLFPNIEVAAFDLGLRPLQRFVDPRVNNRLAFLHA
ncbi:MAG: hypothetical protein ACD_54C01125G0004 [uncultured bacterium]|nr:MAG: hypothetical protein ACD_54C01125G0004 [uncultured bacterium]